VIDRKTALASETLIALMLIAAAWRIFTLEDWTTLELGNGASLPSLLLFVFPVSSAIVVAGLYLNSRRARVTEAKLVPWRKWGRSLSITYCAGLLLLQSLVIVQSLRVDIPFDLAMFARSLGLLLAIMCLLAINQIPKLPWFEPGIGRGGELGPIYGPRYVRIHSRIVVVAMLVVIAISLVSPGVLGWRAAECILLATALLVAWSIAWRVHLVRKWKLEQLTAQTAKPTGASLV
jgi:hypothetical protein